MKTKRMPQAGEFWRTRDGRKVEILAVRKAMLVCGIIDKDDFIRTWQLNGSFFGGVGTDERDLVAPWDEPEPEEYDLEKMWVIWLNTIYPGVGSCLTSCSLSFNSLENARIYAERRFNNEYVIAIVPYGQTKFRKGEGLE